jgi:hypothetical protein
VTDAHTSTTNDMLFEEVSRGTKSQHTITAPPSARPCGVTELD